MPHLWSTLILLNAVWPAPVPFALPGNWLIVYNNSSIRLVARRRWNFLPLYLSCYNSLGLIGDITGNEVVDFEDLAAAGANPCPYIPSSISDSNPWSYILLL